MKFKGNISHVHSVYLEKHVDNSCKQTGEYLCNSIVHTDQVWSSGRHHLCTGEVSMPWEVNVNRAAFMEIFNFPENLMKPNMHKQCVPGSFISANT